jgi:sec-independent protein translocase protein TatA
MGFLGHGWELIIIFVVALLIFGPKKLPEMGSAIGKSIKEFQRGMKEITSPRDDEPSANLEKRTTTENSDVEKRTTATAESSTVDQKTPAE